MAKFPPPCDESFLLLDGKAIPVKEIPPDEWEVYKNKMLDNLGKRMSAYYSGQLNRGE